jgi:urease accessory protein
MRARCGVRWRYEMDALNPDALLGDSTFAANRASGDIALAVAAVAGASRRARVHEAGSLRVRFPNTHRADSLEAVIVNTGGGMTGGDRFAINVHVGTQASLTVTTAAAEKIYRSLGPDTEISVKLKVDAGGALAWLPQETILFDQARLRRAIDVDVAAGASLLLGEAIVFGRAAMNESVVSGYLFDRWRVRVDDALVFAETVRLDGGIAERLAVPAIGGGCVAIATLISIPGNDETVAAVRAVRENFIGEVDASAWNGFAVVRLIAADGAALRHDLIGVLRALRAPLSRLWLN